MTKYKRGKMSSVQQYKSARDGLNATQPGPEQKGQLVKMYNSTRIEPMSPNAISLALTNVP